MSGWIRADAAVFRPARQLTLIDWHPMSPWRRRRSATAGLPYVNDGPRRPDDQGGSYAKPAAATEHNATVEYGHSLGDLVTVAVQAGLVIEHLASTGLSSLPFGRRLLDDGLQRWRCNG